ncbi:MAG TPA: hypothetical protein VGQ84_15095 [Gaiellaceae bacterium]|jgi:hypothetical protein|nr:hypothetical protein [Gaiellaceae bacterium]
MPALLIPSMLSAQLEVIQIKETAVIYWKVKQGLVFAAIAALGLIGACAEHADHFRGFYW